LVRRITTPQEVDEARGKPLAILFKHSTACPISARAHGEVRAFLEAHPEAPVYLVHVIEDRPAARYIAQQTGIAHASPQLIVLREGTPVWHTSHLDVTAAAMAEHVT
jgi:bacillithiol system protein YtxJ